MSFDLDSITWTCHACGQLRPDRLIGVVSVKWETPEGCEGRVNMRYCKDNPQCLPTATAKAEAFASDMERPREE